MPKSKEGKPHIKCGGSNQSQEGTKAPPEIDPALPFAHGHGVKVMYACRVAMKIKL